MHTYPCNARAQQYPRLIVPHLAVFEISVFFVLFWLQVGAGGNGRAANGGDSEGIDRFGCLLLRRIFLPLFLLCSKYFAEDLGLLVERRCATQDMLDLMISE